ncbi:hypothetical protein [Frankia sp. AvcI1]|uniref:hypothetical protein n=1 Tax=Frankia sp. AvcI1 TaxID=573496 RepID=UPI0006EC2524|nr:hypothetical protein [Frankia sp. AvcI1]
MPTTLQILGPVLYGRLERAGASADEIDQLAAEHRHPQQAADLAAEVARIGDQALAAYLQRRRDAVPRPSGHVPRGGQARSPRHANPAQPAPSDPPPPSTAEGDLPPVDGGDR